MGTYIIHFDDKPWEDLDDEQYYRCKEIPWFSTTKTTISRLTPCTEPDLDAVKKEAYQQGHKDGYNKHDTEKIRKQGYDKGLDDIGNALRLLLFQYSNYTLQTIFGYDTARAVVEHFEGSEIVARIRCYEGGVKQDAETIRKKAYEKAYEQGRKDEKIEGQAETWVCVKKIAFKPEIAECVDDLVRIGFDVGTADSWSEAIELLFEKYSASEVIEKIRQYEQEKEEQIQVGDEVNLKCGVGPAIYMQGTNGSDEIYLLFNDGSCGMHSRSEIERKTGKHFPEIAEVLQKMKES